MKQQKPLTITVGIPTCYGGVSLVETVKSLRSTKGGQDITILVTADRTPVIAEIKKQLRQLGVDFQWNPAEGSQFKKIKQMVDSAKSDIFISTQDDITFDPHLLEAVTAAFYKTPQLTMAGVRVQPLKPVTLWESVFSSEVRVHDVISRVWNKGQNYYAASGRCLAFRTSFLKTFRLPDKVVNGDTFLYFENKRLQGKFQQQPAAIVYIRCPQTLNDQLGPSSRFQYSQNELLKYFDYPITPEYKIPVKVLLGAALSEFIAHPLYFLAYIGIFIYLRVKHQSRSVVTNPIWKVDASTKNI